MSELPDSPSVAQRYCPGCEPERDPLVGIVEILWCDPHLPSREGYQDVRATVSQDVLLSGGEVEGVNNRQWCEMIHRGQPS